MYNKDGKSKLTSFPRCAMDEIDTLPTCLPTIIDRYKYQLWTYLFITIQFNGCYVTQDRLIITVYGYNEMPAKKKMSCGTTNICRIFLCELTQWLYMRDHVVIHVWSESWCHLYYRTYI